MSYLTTQHCGSQTWFKVRPYSRNTNFNCRTSKNVSSSKANEADLFTYPPSYSPVPSPYFATLSSQPGSLVVTRHKPIQQASDFHYCYISILLSQKEYILFQVKA